MTDFESLSASERLSALLDGELDASQSSTMFYELGNNPELQMEMQQLLAIRNSFRNSRVAPPAAMKEAILAKTGLSAASGSLLAGFFSSKAFMIVSSFLVSSLLTYFAVGFLSNDEKPGEEIATANTHTKPLIIPVSYSEEADNKTDISNNDVRYIRNSQPYIVYNSNNNSISSKYQELTGSDIHPSKYKNLPQEKFDSPVDIANLRPKNRLLIEDININLTDKTNNPDIFPKEYGRYISRLSLNVRGFSATSYPDLDIVPLSDPTLNSFALGLSYDLDENNSLGFEIGQENFLQQYTGVENNHPVSYEQNYHATWAGVVYQYTHSSSNNIRPFARGFLGGTNVGPLGKAMLGFKYDLSNNFAMTAGIEGTAHPYNYQQEWFATYKLGFTYGLSLRF